MKKKVKRLQLRRCQVCNKAGHNRSTCPVFLAQKKRTAASTPNAPQKNSSTVKFFVHHVTHETTQSPHVVDLKQSHYNAWENVESAAPSISSNPLYHFHHRIKPAPLNIDFSVEKEEDSNESAKEETILPEKLLKQKKIEKTTAPIFSPSIKKIPRENVFKKQLLKAKNSWQNFKNNIQKNFPLRRLAISITLLAVILIAPGPVRSYYSDVKLTTNTIAADSTAGFSALQESTAQLMQANLTEAESSITGALTNFESAVSKMQSKHRWLQQFAAVIPGLSDDVQSRQNLILAGQELALGNTYLLKGIGESQAASEETLTKRINTIMVHLRAAIPNYEKATEHLNSIDADSLPVEYQKTFSDFKNLFATILNDFKNLDELGGSIQEIFGGAGLRRYLLVFQNPNEMRPTGGFIGSFALIEVKDGKISKLEVPAGGSYDLQGQLDTYLEPPTPLLLTNRRWEFQDANWFPDFSASAQKILWFYRHSRNISADGVIAINSSVLERLLSVMGPITDTKRQVTITQENAITTIQKIVEEGPEKKQKKPKQILSDLAPQFLTYLENVDPKNLIPLLTNLQEALEQKEIQTYFTDNNTEKSLRNFGWTGEILPTTKTQDYLMVVNTNIQGQKTDANIRQEISHQAIVENDGTITDTVVISRTHTAATTGSLYDSANIDYLRIYVPAGSELISAGGFSWPPENKFRVPEKWAKPDEFLMSQEKEIKIDENSGTRVTNEFGKTAFGNWIITEPGTTSQIVFTYRLPFKVVQSQNDLNAWKKILGGSEKTATYQLVAQKQSGCNSTFESQIIFPENYTPAWKEGKNISLASNGIAINQSSFVTDSIWSLIMREKKS